MRGSKKEIHDGVFSAIETEDFQRIFERMRAAAPALSGFGSPGELVSFLHDWDAETPDANDAVLHALILQACGRPDGEAEVQTAAQTLLTAAMWPAISTAYWRALPLLSANEDPFSEVYWAFLEEVYAWNLEKTTKVAANLRMNTEKRVRETAKAEKEHLETTETVKRQLEVSGCASLAEIALRPRRMAEPDARKRRLLSVLQRLVEEGVISQEDGHLIAGHAVYGKCLQELASDLGLKYRTASKRYQRATAVVREALRKKVRGIPDSFVS